MTKDEFFSTEKEEFRKEFLLDLSNFCKCYVNDVCNKVIKQFDKIVSNELILNMLHELRIREEKELKAFTESFSWRLGEYLDDKNYDMSYNLHNNPTSHAGSYRAVLYDLLVK